MLLSIPGTVQTAIAATSCPVEGEGFSVPPACPMGYLARAALCTGVHGELKMLYGSRFIAPVHFKQ